MAYQAKLIHETERTEVFHLPGDSPFVIVSFSERGMRANGKDFWGRSMFETLGVEAIGITAREPHWFPRTDFVNYRQMVRETLDRSGKNRIGYGYSMGAYGAIKHAAALDLHQVIAYAPHWSIAPEDMGGHAPTWLADYDPSLHAEMRITGEDTGGAEIYSFSDPLDPLEAFHAEKLAAASPDRVHHVPIRHAGHHIGVIMAGRDCFCAVTAALEEAPITRLRTLSEITRSTKKKSEYYLFNLSNRLWERGRYKSYEALVERSFQAHPSSMGISLLYGRLAAHNRDAATFDTTMCDLVALKPNNPHVHGWWGEGALMLGLIDEALNHFRKAAELAPTMPHLQERVRNLEGQHAQNASTHSSQR